MSRYVFLREYGFSTSILMVRLKMHEAMGVWDLSYVMRGGVFRGWELCPFQELKGSSKYGAKYILNWMPKESSKCCMGRLMSKPIW